MALRVFPENLSSIGPEIDFFKSNKLSLGKITECTVPVSWQYLRCRHPIVLGWRKAFRFCFAILLSQHSNEENQVVFLAWKDKYCLTRMHLEKSVINLTF